MYKKHFWDFTSTLIFFLNNLYLYYNIYITVVLSRKLLLPLLNLANIVTSVY